MHREHPEHKKKWKEGITDFNVDSVFIGEVELKIKSGQAYLIDHSKNTQIELQDPSYTDFIQYKNLIILSTFAAIDIYDLMDFKVHFKIDDIDGIKLNKVESGILMGNFNQFEQDADRWIDFRIDLSSLEFFCDHGRMWIETKEHNGHKEIKYKTMDIKK